MTEPLWQLRCKYAPQNSVPRTWFLIKISLPDQLESIVNRNMKTKSLGHATQIVNSVNVLPKFVLRRLK